MESQFFEKVTAPFRGHVHEGHVARVIALKRPQAEIVNPGYFLGWDALLFVPVGVSRSKIPDNRDVSDIMWPLVTSHASTYRMLAKGTDDHFVYSYATTIALLHVDREGKPMGFYPFMHKDIERIVGLDMRYISNRDKGLADRLNYYTAAETKNFDALLKDRLKGGVNDSERVTAQVINATVAYRHVVIRNTAAIMSDDVSSSEKFHCVEELVKLRDGIVRKDTETSRILAESLSQVIVSLADFKGTGREVSEQIKKSNTPQAVREFRQQLTPQPVPSQPQIYQQAAANPLGPGPTKPSP